MYGRHYPSQQKTGRRSVACSTNCCEDSCQHWVEEPRLTHHDHADTRTWGTHIRTKNTHRTRPTMAHTQTDNMDMTLPHTGSALSYHGRSAVRVHSVIIGWALLLMMSVPTDCMWLLPFSANPGILPCTCRTRRQPQYCILKSYSLAC